MTTFFKLFVVFIQSFSLPIYAQHETCTINDGWKFLKADCVTAPDIAPDNGEWEDVHLPHTWNTDAYTDKDYYRGVCWYRRTLNLPSTWNGKQVFLKIDAASKAASIFINGKEVGEHIGGYTACTFDITSFCSFDSPNSLAIRVDNARHDVPPISADFL